MTTDEKNRKIAESVEPKPTGFTAGICGPSPLKCWYVDDYWQPEWKPVDFFAVESASAQLLEKMPYPRVYRHKNMWVCEADWRFFHNEATSTDRKTAIAEAYFKLKFGD